VQITPADRQRTRRVRLAFTIALLAWLVASLLLPAIPQPQWYHAFADAREFLGIANFWNVASNAPIGVAGAIGLNDVLTRRGLFLERAEASGYACFFAAMIGVTLGSAYYHLAPDDARLLWDRLPIGMATAVLPIAVLSDHLGARVARPLLIPALVAGAASAIYWALSEQAGHGNLVPYLSLQLLSIGAVALLARRPGRYTRARDLWVVIGFYALARVAEVFDSAIYRAGEFLSGHSVKHLLAALAAAWVLRMIRLRTPVVTTAAAST
jgi:hypothetical protein